MRFVDTALLSFSLFKGLFLHLLCVTVYASLKLIGHLNLNQASRLTRLRPFCNSLHVVLKSIASIL